MKYSVPRHRMTHMTTQPAARRASRFLLLAVCVCGVAPASALAQSAPTIIRKGNEQYRAGNFADALKTYESAAKVDPDSLEAKFNQGVAAFKAGDTELSRRLFREVDSAGGNPELASAARYNLGVLETQQLHAAPPDDPEKALESLKSAASQFRGSLDLSPHDADAARNLELTRLAIKDLREQIERQKELQRQMQELKDQLKQNQKEQENAAQQNQERAADQQSDQEQKQEAQKQQEQVSKQTQQAQQQLDNLRKQLGDSPADDPQEPEESEESEEPDGTETPKAQRVGDEPTPQEKLKVASKSLEKARKDQEQAQEKLEQGDLQAAEKEQKEAAEKIKKALEDLGSPQGEKSDDPNQEEQQPDQQEEQQPEQQPEQPAEQPQPSPEQQGEPAEQQEGEGESATDARLGRILEKERRDRELKQQVLKKQRARNRPVDKDW